MQNFGQPVNTEINPINNKNILKYYVNTIKIIILIKKNKYFLYSVGYNNVNHVMII